MISHRSVFHIVFFQTLVHQLSLHHAIDRGGALLRDVLSVPAKQPFIHKCSSSLQEVMNSALPPNSLPQPEYVQRLVQIILATLKETSSSEWLRQDAAVVIEGVLSTCTSRCSQIVTSDGRSKQITVSGCTPAQSRAFAVFNALQVIST